jgi:hypothetical protein
VRVSRPDGPPESFRDDRVYGRPLSAGHVGRWFIRILRASVRHTDAFSGEGQRDATLAGFPAQPVSSAI